MLPEQYAPLGATEEVGRKLLAAAVQRGEPDLRSVRGVRRALLEAVESATSAAPMRVLRRQAATDGFVKYLFELEGGAQVEAVRIPIPCEAPGADTSAYAGKEKKYIVCVSSQAGCALACAFCATGTLGFRRNLRAHEIVADGRRTDVPDFNLFHHLPGLRAQNRQPARRQHPQQQPATASQQFHSVNSKSRRRH